MSEDLMCLPDCPHEGHGKMELRSKKWQTPEQKYCGVWYDCQYPGCMCSVLFMSQDIRKLYRTKDGEHSD
ncbi:MAG: hypothetical protein ABF969_11960 [Sporolactobacillus sp.]